MKKAKFLNIPLRYYNVLAQRLMYLNFILAMLGRAWFGAHSFRQLSQE
jgi:hypothetical protein